MVFQSQFRGYRDPMKHMRERKVESKNIIGVLESDSYTFVKGNKFMFYVKCFLDE